MWCYRQPDAVCGTVGWGCYCEAQDLFSPQPGNTEQCQSRTALIGGIVYSSLAGLCLLYMLYVWYRAHFSSALPVVDNTAVPSEPRLHAISTHRSYDPSTPLLVRPQPRPSHRLRYAWVLFLALFISGVFNMCVAYSFINASRGQEIHCASNSLMLATVCVVGVCTLIGIALMAFLFSLCLTAARPPPATIVINNIPPTTYGTPVMTTAAAAAPPATAYATQGWYSKPGVSSV